MIFIVEDEPVLRRSFVDFLRGAGQEVEGFETAELALDSARSSPPDVAVCDLQLPGMNGLELMEKLTEIDPSIIRIAMTAHSSVQTAVRAMRSGCYEYLEKPVDLERLSRMVERALVERKHGRELDWLKTSQLSDEMLGESPAVQQVRSQIATIAQLGADGPPVLLTGETGVGKGLAAKLIHEQRFGADAPWIEINCAALPATLIEAELFGYERSAFTDARQAKPGLFEAASGGTIFLDEIGELQLDIQSKLLKVVESGGVRRLGSVRERPTTAAIIAASNVRLHEAIQEGTFRQDLYHRLAAFTIEVPPLRERGEDALLLAEVFLAAAAARYKKPLAALSGEAKQRILAHSWPGNVRELRFAIERAVIQATPDERALGARHLPAPDGAVQVAAGGGPSVGARADGSIQIQLPEGGIPMADLEREILVETLKMAHGNVVQAARFLDLKRDAMRYRIRKFGLDPDDFK